VTQLSDSVCFQFGFINHLRPNFSIERTIYIISAKILALD
jgi:hypothetical protein